MSTISLQGINKVISDSESDSISADQYRLLTAITILLGAACDSGGEASTVNQFCGLIGMFV